MPATFVVDNNKDKLKNYLQKINGKTAQEIIEVGEKK